MRVRFDRLATVYLAHPLRGVFRGDRHRAVPVLMYHSISEDVGGISHPYYEINTSPAVFESHMRFLRENDYTAIGFRDLEDGAPGDGLQPKRVVITFDDGYADFYHAAHPILERYGFRAVMFLVTNLVGTGRSGHLHGKEMLGWNDVRALRSIGTMFGAHTVNHPVLIDLKCAEMEAELLQSKKRIEEELGEPIDAFSCPYAFPQEDSAFQVRYFSALKDIGYRYGVTTMIGRYSRGDDLLKIRRLPVNRYDDRDLFQAKLEGGYDWLGALQCLHRNTTARTKKGMA